MTKSLVFRIPTISDSKEKMIYDLNLNLKKILSNSRTTIYENSELRLCIDHTVVRVLLFNDENYILTEKLRGYFYGEEYKSI